MRGPARLLIDDQGNQLGVVLDGTVYRLQVQAVVADSDGTTSDVETEGSRAAQAVSYPELLAAVQRIGDRLDRVLAQLATMTGEEDPL